MATEDFDVVELMDDEGNKLSFEHLLTFEVEDEFFIAVTPVEDLDEFKKDEVLIMRVSDDGEEGDVYLPIESQEELDKLWDIFQELYYSEDEDGCDCGSDECSHSKKE